MVTQNAAHRTADDGPLPEPVVRRRMTKPRHPRLTDTGTEMDIAIIGTGNIAVALAGRRTQDAGGRTQDAGRRTQDAGRRTQDAGRMLGIRSRSAHATPTTPPRSSFRPLWARASRHPKLRCPAARPSPTPSPATRSYRPSSPTSHAAVTSPSRSSRTSSGIGDDRCRPALASTTRSVQRRGDRHCHHPAGLRRRVLEPREHVPLSARAARPFHEARQAQARLCDDRVSCRATLLARRTDATCCGLREGRCEMADR